MIPGRRTNAETTESSKQDHHAAAPASLIRVSTEMFPEKERFAAFREEFVRRHLAMDVIDHSGGRPRAAVTLMPLGPVQLMGLDTAPAEFIREKHHLKDRRSEAVQLGIVRGGSVHLRHAGDEHTYGGGSVAFIDQGRQWQAVGLDHIHLRKINVATAALKVLVHEIEDLAGHPVRPGPALHLLDGYMRSLDEAPPPEALAEVVGGHLLDLMAAVLGARQDATEAIERGGVRAARLRIVLDAIARRFADPGFNVDAAARAAGLSRRYLQDLLGQTGRSFTDHVLERRLERARALLADPRRRHLSITEIALVSGFGDISHFTRSFRRRYGDTPSGMRAPKAHRSGPDPGC